MGKTGGCGAGHDLGVHSAGLGDLLECLGLTGEDGAELGPAGDPPFRGVLAQRHLQEEHRESAAEQEDEVGDQKRTCEGDRKQLRPPLAFSRLLCPSTAYLRRFCNKGRGNARRSLSR